MGLLKELVRLVDAVHRHERGLSERIARELQFAVQTPCPDNGDDRSPQAAGRIRELFAEQAFSRCSSRCSTCARGHKRGWRALARFNAAPQHSPDRWFAEAASVGCGADLELAAVRRALERSPDMPPGLFLAVNVSPSTVLDRQLGNICTTVPHPPLLLEITEHAPVDDYGALKNALLCLRTHGARLAIDDAGAGFASLRHIVRLEPDVIKLDGSLVRDIHLEPVRRSLASSLVVFADQTGSVIVAEGIERRRSTRSCSSSVSTSGRATTSPGPAPTRGWHTG